MPGTGPRDRVRDITSPIYTQRPAAADIRELTGPRDRVPREIEFYFTDQPPRYLFSGRTTDATPAALTEYNQATADNKLEIPVGVTYYDIVIIAWSDTPNTAAKYRRTLTVKKAGGTSALLSTVETVGTDHEDTAGWDVAITVDDTDDEVVITVTGAAATTIDWYAFVQAYTLPVAGVGGA